VREFDLIHHWIFASRPSSSPYRARSVLRLEFDVAHRDVLCPRHHWRTVPIRFRV